MLATDNRHRNDATMEQITEYLERFLQIREIYKPLVAKNTSKGGADSPAPKAANDEPWWENEDAEAPWMTQTSRLLPNCTLALWQFTPYVLVAQ